MFGLGTGYASSVVRDRNRLRGLSGAGVVAKPIQLDTLFGAREEPFDS